MAPTKEKKEKLTANEGADLILDYLTDPTQLEENDLTLYFRTDQGYKAADISSNLLNRVSKTHTQKYLKELEERNRIASRAAGKQIVYHSLQSLPSVDESTSKDVEELNNHLETLRTNITTLKSTEKFLKAELASLATLRTFDEIQSTVEALKGQKEGLFERLSDLKSSATDVRPIGEAEKATIEADLTKWKKQAKLRKAAVRDLWYMMKDTPKSDPSMNDADLWEYLGCEGSMP